MLSREALLASARATHERLGGAGQWLLALPVNGVAGLQILVRSVLSGRPPIFADDHSDLGAAVAAMEGPLRYASLVPTQLHRLAQDDRLSDLAGLTAVLIGGAGLDADLREAAVSAGVRIVRTYGMSETAGGCVYDGVPLDGVDIRIDGEGIVHVAGPTLFDRYEGDPERTARVLQNGWFRTDDKGRWNPDGTLHVIGRSDDVVISGGVNVPLPAVTSALRQVEGVYDAVAVGVDDAEWGHRVVALVVPRDAVCLDGLRVDAVRDALEEGGMAREWAPRDVVLVDVIPHLRGGKLDRLAARRIAQSG